MLNKLKKAVPTLSVMAAVYYADSLIFGSIAVALTVWLGGWVAFAVLTPAYFALDYALGRMSLRLVIEEKRAKKCGRLMRFVRRWFASLRAAIPAIEKRLSKKSRLRLRVSGFVFASYFGTAFLTIPAMYILGQRRYLRTLTAISAVIYAVTYVGQYALGTSIVLGIARQIGRWF